MNPFPGIYACPNCGPLPMAVPICPRCGSGSIIVPSQQPPLPVMPQNTQHTAQNALPAGFQNAAPAPPYPAQQWNGPVGYPPVIQAPQIVGWVPTFTVATWQPVYQMQHFPAPIIAPPQGNVQQPQYPPNFLNQTAQFGPPVQPVAATQDATALPVQQQQPGFVEEHHLADPEPQPEPTPERSENNVSSESEEEDEEEVEHHVRVQSRPKRRLPHNKRPREGMIYFDSDDEEFSITLRRTRGAHCKKCHILGHTTRQHNRWDKTSPVRSP
jgi:hypothetical protein